MISKKNLGLDLIRIFAAFLVIICHSGYFSVGIPFAVVSTPAYWLWNFSSF